VPGVTDFELKNPSLLARRPAVLLDPVGATITGPRADLNLGTQTYLNGPLVSNTVIDTSQVATDQNGLTLTSTHTVISWTIQYAAKATAK
jgi:hypothetical protein